MGFPGAYLVIIYTVLLHFTILGTNSWLINLLNTDSKIVIFSVQGLVFISYPLIGLLADIKLTRYRMICLSCWTLLIGHAVLLINGTLSIFTDHISYQIQHQHVYGKVCLVIGAIGLLLIIVGKGMFESTVIQFGTDQMIEASSAQLSTFMHWYYWSLYVGNVCINVITVGTIGYFSYCNISLQTLFSGNDNTVLGWIIVPPALLQCILCCITLPLLYLKKFKKYLNIESVGVNPVKQIIDVIKYAYHHKYPVNRSALSYYLNTYPSRLDFGKVQYGGPFTNDEVEGTKTVLRLLVLLLSLFGFHLASDGFSNGNHILHKTCTSSFVLLYFISNPLLLSNVITLLGVPLFHLVKSSLQRCLPNMLKRMWLGLFFLWLQELSSLIISGQVEYTACETFNVTSVLRLSSSSIQCFFSVIEYANRPEWNTTDCITLCPSSLYTMDSTLMWLLVPQILHGFGYMLVFASVLEFICAQAPFRLKGFIVGIWYAMFSLKILVVNIVDIVTFIDFKKEKAWIIYESIRIGIIGLSLIIFGISCRWYHYRERDEVYNLQGTIADIFEEELTKHNEDSSDDEDSNDHEDSSGDEDSNDHEDSSDDEDSNDHEDSSDDEALITLAK